MQLKIVWAARVPIEVNSRPHVIKSGEDAHLDDQVLETPPRTIFRGFVSLHVLVLLVIARLLLRRFRIPECALLDPFRELEQDGRAFLAVDLVQVDDVANQASEHVPGLVVLARDGIVVEQPQTQPRPFVADAFVSTKTRRSRRSRDRSLGSTCARIGSVRDECKVGLLEFGRDEDHGEVQRLESFLGRRRRSDRRQIGRREDRRDEMALLVGRTEERMNEVVEGLGTVSRNQPPTSDAPLRLVGPLPTCHGIFGRALTSTHCSFVSSSAKASLPTLRESA